VTSFAGLRRKTKDIFLHHILHADDSPGRIALGAAIGMFVAWTPTIGAQMLIAVSLAAFLGANKAVTLPVVWITNPVTVVPIYWFNYRLGYFLITGDWHSGGAVRGKIVEMCRASLGTNIFSDTYWRDLTRLMVDIGWPLWTGSIFTGLILGLITYVAIRQIVLRHRFRKSLAALEDAVEQEVHAAGQRQSEKSDKEKNHNAA